MATRTQAFLTMALAVVVIAIGACTSTASSPSAAVSVAPAPSSAASAAAGVCADAAAVKSAVTDLKGMDLKTAGKAGLTTAVETVQSSATTLATSAKDAAGPEAAALRGLDRDPQDRHPRPDQRCERGGEGLGHPNGGRWRRKRCHGTQGQADPVRLAP